MKPLTHVTQMSTPHISNLHKNKSKGQRTGSIVSPEVLRRLSSYPVSHRQHCCYCCCEYVFWKAAQRLRIRRILSVIARPVSPFSRCQLIIRFFDSSWRPSEIQLLHEVLPRGLPKCRVLADQHLILQS